MSPMRMPRRLFVAVALLVFSAFTTRADAAAPGPLGALQAQLSALSMHAPGNVGIMMDTFHYWKSQVPDADILAIPKEKLFIVHVNDSEDLPPAEAKDSNRMHVGEGILPLDHDLDLIRRVGYDGYLSVEIFREEYWKQPVEQVVADAKASLDRWLSKPKKQGN